MSRSNKSNSVCKCGHRRYDHRTEMTLGESGWHEGICLVRNCPCALFRRDMKVGVISKYCQDTPPPTYSPSPEPEPIQW